MSPLMTTQTSTRQAATAHIAITVNGEPRQTSSATLADLLVEAGYAGAKVATAVNGDFVPAKMRAGKALGDGDHVEIVAPRQGG